MAGRPSGPSVLVVEGQRSLHPLIEAVFSRAGLTRVTLQENSARALDPYVAHDVLVIDARDRRHDPERFGQLAGRAKADRAILLLMATSTDRGSLSTIREGLCDLILLKPFTADEVRRKLEGQQIVLPPKPKLTANGTGQGAEFGGNFPPENLEIPRHTVSI